MAKKTKYSGKRPVKCAVVGASGYAGIETMRLLSAHPMAQVVFATSNTYRDKEISSVFPQLDAVGGLYFEPHKEAALFEEADVFFLALPHGKSYDLIDSLLSRARVIDISADFRLKEAGDYARWYDYDHPIPDLLESAVYGLTEINRKEIKKAKLLANPGCYPTSVALGLYPLAEATEHVTGPIIIDSKSGYSGAGRSPKSHLLFAEAHGDFKVYAPIGHRHTSEMLQETKKIFGWKMPVTFTPHLIPVPRGILSTIYVPLQGDVTEAKLRGIYDRFYKAERFVKFLAPGAMPSIKMVRGTNECHVNLFVDPDTNVLKIVSVIDNLMKGAAGQAVQNMNVMFGLPESAGLEAGPVLP